MYGFWGGSKLKKIRIAQNGLIKKLETENLNEAVTYKMVVAGEVLNCHSLDPQIRVCVIERNILQDLEQKEYLPKNLTRINNLKILGEQQIEQLRASNQSESSIEPEWVYCKLSQKITANQKFRLLSFHPAEKLFGIVGDAVGLQIEKGDDDFFYATSKTARLLEFVVVAPHPDSHSTNYENLPENDLIKKIIDEYQRII